MLAQGLHPIGISNSIVDTDALSNAANPGWSGSPFLQCVCNCPLTTLLMPVLYIDHYTNVASASSKSISWQ